MEKEKLYQIALTQIKYIGPKHVRSLLNSFGNAESIFTAELNRLLRVDGIGKKLASQILETDALRKAKEQLDYINKHQIQVLFINDIEYPARLRQCDDAPIVLYYKGNTNLNAKRVVSIVGTRNATAYGLNMCRNLVSFLLKYDVLVVSGLAYGIDVAAHQESITRGIPTVGVLGHGLDRIYPSSHTNIAHKMKANGGLLSEFLPGTCPDKENFPQRNRIIAGMCDVLVVVEASTKGGALISAEIANTYNRDVFAFPGRSTDAYSAGCNFLIKTNRAGLISEAKDLPYYMGWDDYQNKKSSKQVVLPINLNSKEQEIFDLLQMQAFRIDQLTEICNLNPSELAVTLLSLEMQGIIVCLPGKCYQLA